GLALVDAEEVAQDPLGGVLAEVKQDEEQLVAGRLQHRLAAGPRGALERAAALLPAGPALSPPQRPKQALRHRHGQAHELAEQARPGAGVLVLQHGWHPPTKRQAPETLGRGLALCSAADPGGRLGHPRPVSEDTNFTKLVDTNPYEPARSGLPSHSLA